MTDQNNNPEEEIKKDNEKTGSMAGAGAGALAGAQVGTVLIPIPVVGTFTGALVGGLVGTKVGKKVGGAILSKVQGVQGQQSATPPTGKVDVAAELQRLAELKAQGIIDEDEFKAAKAKVLGL